MSNINLASLSDTMCSMQRFGYKSVAVLGAICHVHKGHSALLENSIRFTSVNLLKEHSFKGTQMHDDVIQQ